MDPTALGLVLGRQALGAERPDRIAIDGKTRRGGRRAGEGALHVLSAFATGLSAVVGDLAAAPEENEIVAARALLRGLALERAAVTGDAICWRVEDRLHWRRDASMNEDRGTARAGARTLAAFRSLARALMRGSKTSVPAIREAFAARPLKALRAEIDEIPCMALGRGPHGVDRPQALR